MSLLIGLIIIGLIMAVIPTFVWSKKYGKKYISADMLPIRKKYRICLSVGFLLFTVAGLTLIEMMGLVDSYFELWFIIPGIIMAQNRMLFEPYHTSEIVSELDNFCLYLRPFDLSTKAVGYWAKGGLYIPESLEKILCGEINKRIAKTYCIGDPNSAMPTTLSTSGIYASDAEWKSVVGRMANNSKLILLRVMDTDGCKWELNYCINQYIDKTIFLIAEEKHILLLQDYIKNIHVELPNVAILNNGCVALYLDIASNQWNAIVLKNISDIRLMIKNYIRGHNDIKQEINLSEIIKYPFKKMDIPSKWAHIVSLWFQPFWYLTFNKWPKVWNIVFIVDILLFWCGGFILSIFCNDFLYFIIGAIIGVLPWFWLAPRVTTRFNTWGSVYLSRLGNITLCKWIILFTLLSTVVSVCIELSKDNLERAKEFAKYVLVEENGYQEYCALETEVDSLYNDIYTDNNVRINAWGYINAVHANDKTKMEQYAEGFYDSVLAVDETQFKGWVIMHKFQHLSSSGMYEENLCMILTDENYEEYIILSLDENDRHINFFETEEIIDEIISEFNKALDN